MTGPGEHRSLLSSLPLEDVEACAIIVVNDMVDLINTIFDDPADGLGQFLDTAERIHTRLQELAATASCGSDLKNNLEVGDDRREKHSDETPRQTDL